MAKVSMGCLVLVVVAGCGFPRYSFRRMEEIPDGEGIAMGKAWTQREGLPDPVTAIWTLISFPVDFAQGIVTFFTPLGLLLREIGFARGWPKWDLGALP